MFAILNAAYRTLAHRLQRGVIKLSRILLSHIQRDSYSLDHVKKNLPTYVLINNLSYSVRPEGTYHQWRKNPSR
jgi:hypothetical protein